MQIDRINLSDIYFKVNKDFTPSEEFTIDTEIAVESRHHKKTNACSVTLCAKALGDNYPFEFNVTYEGFASFSDEETKDAEQLCNINFPAAIFPYVRECVADLTRRAGFPPLHIASVNFIEASKSREPITE